MQGWPAEWTSERVDEWMHPCMCVCVCVRVNCIEEREGVIHPSIHPCVCVLSSLLVSSRSNSILQWRQTKLLLLLLVVVVWCICVLCSCEWTRKCVDEPVSEGVACVCPKQRNGWVDGSLLTRRRGGRPRAGQVPMKACSKGRKAWR